MTSETRESRRRTNLRRLYGLSEAEYASMHARQGGVCALCDAPETALHPDGSVKPLAVDHDHRTGAVRGLLCHRCNVRVGWLETLLRDADALLRSIRYVSIDGEERPDFITDEATALFMADAAQRGMTRDEYQDRYGIVLGAVANKYT